MSISLCLIKYRNASSYLLLKQLQYYVKPCQYSSSQSKETELSDQSESISKFDSVENESTYYDEDDKNTINKIRDKSKMLPHIKQRYFNDEITYKFPFQYTLTTLRSYYGKHGKKSRLNPGLCYPTPEELQFKSEYEATANRPLKEMVESYQRKCATEIEVRKKREEEVDSNMNNLAKWRKEMLDKEAKRIATAEAQMAKRAKLVEEVRQELGFNVQTSDPRFKEALERREIAEKKDKKMARKLQSIEKKKLMVEKKKAQVLEEFKEKDED